MWLEVHCKGELSQHWEVRGEHQADGEGAAASRPRAGTSLVPVRTAEASVAGAEQRAKREEGTVQGKRVVWAMEPDSGGGVRIHRAPCLLSAAWE